MIKLTISNLAPQWAIELVTQIERALNGRTLPGYAFDSDDGLPPATPARQIISITDRAYQVAYSDGEDWRWVSNNSVVS